ncbi:MAG: CNNM domain-containing protein [Bacteroidota bacterium]
MDFLIVTLLVILSGCFSGLTLGFFSLNLTSLERKMKLGDRRARKIYPVRKNGNLLLCTLLLGNVAVNSAMAIFLGNIATGLIAGIVSTGLIVVFGEIIPQAIFSRHALRLGSSTVWLVRIFIFLLYPVAGPMAWLLNKALGEELATIWNKKEIEEIIRFHEDAEEGEIDEDEERIMLGALAFSDMTARMVATPRTVVFSLPQDQALDNSTLQRIREKGFSRIPVFEEDPDDISGVLLVKDLVGLDPGAGKLVQPYVRTDTLFVRDNIKLDKLLNHFISQKRHIACIYDEFGVFYGIVTMEDIIEEILKTEILDESDQIRDMRASAVALRRKNLLE